jgi:hypothetical protein
MNDGHRRPSRLSRFILKFFKTCVEPFGAVPLEYIAENLTGLAHKLFRILCWFARLPQCLDGNKCAECCQPGQGGASQAILLVDFFSSFDTTRCQRCRSALR